MVVVAMVALGTMVSNTILLPLMLRGKLMGSPTAGLGRTLLRLRRLTIAVLMSLAYLYYLLGGESESLADIAMTSFVAIAQLSPAFLGAMIWRRGTSFAAVAAILTGALMWGLTMVLPQFVNQGLLPVSWLEDGLFGLEALRPNALFFLDLHPLANATLFSLGPNVIVYILASFYTQPSASELVQAAIYSQPSFDRSGLRRLTRGSNVPVGELKQTVENYLGEGETNRVFALFSKETASAFLPSDEATAELFQYCERLLSSAIGPASARLVLKLLRQSWVAPNSKLTLLDDASRAINANRGLLQSAIDQVKQGIAVADDQLTLISWNAAFTELLHLKESDVKSGVGLEEILLPLAKSGQFGEGKPEQLVDEKLKAYLQMGTFEEVMHKSGDVLQIHFAHIPDGGLVLTLTDITEEAERAKALEKMVEVRTQELTELNQALIAAKAVAERSNQSKTLFLAAAGHDILQPLNAARLYLSGVMDRSKTDLVKELANKSNASLEAVEEIIRTLLDISRLDTGAMKPAISDFAVGSLLERIEVEMKPAATDRGLELKVVQTNYWTRSDVNLLSRLVRNLVSNAVNYTASGRVLIGCRHRQGAFTIEVLDTGNGIEEKEHQRIFEEFQRLENPKGSPQGLGLGLSIVDRIGRMLGHSIELDTVRGKGSCFRVVLPRIEPGTPARPQKESQPQGQTDFEGWRILCIDNDRAILDAMDQLLSGWGCRVSKALGLEEALTLGFSPKNTPDIILADYHLDGLNGLETILALRTHWDHEIPASLLTAEHDLSLRDQALEQGIIFLNKPIKSNLLRNVMKKLQKNS